MKDDGRWELGAPFAALTEYETDHLVSHLVLGEQLDAVQRLLSIEANGVHAWSAHKRARDRRAGLVSDLELARDQAIGSGQPGLATRYALIRASLVATANEAPAELIAAEARYGALSLDEAINQAVDRADPAERARLSAALSEIAIGQKAAAAAQTASLNALAAVEEIGLNQQSLAIFGDIVNSLAPAAISSAAQLVRRARPARAGRAVLQLAMTRDRSDPVWRQFFDEARTLARQETDPLLRSLLLAELGAASEGSERRALHNEALAAADEEADQVYRSRLLGQIAPHLADDQIQSLWEHVRNLPDWILEQGRWRVRQEAVVGVAPAAARAGLHELALEAAAALEDTGWEAEAQLAVIDTAGGLPEPLAGQLLTQLAEAIDGEVQLRKPAVARLFRLVASHAKACMTAQEVSATYAHKRYDLWLQTMLREGWSISDRVVAAAASRCLPTPLRGAVIRLLDSHPETRDLVTDVMFLIQADLPDKALAAADSATPAARLELAVKVSGAQRQRLIESALAAIGTDDPHGGALLAAKAAEIVPLNTAIAILHRAQEQVERLSDAGIIKEMASALRQPPPIPEFAAGTPVTPTQHQNNASLSAAIAKAIELSDREPRYDDPSPRQEQLDILMPQVLEHGMFDVYVTAAAAYPTRFTGRTEFLGHLFNAGAYQTAFNAFARLDGSAASSELAQAAGHLPDNLFETWMNCVLTLQPPQERAKPIAAAGHRLLPTDVFERALHCNCELIGAEARQTALVGLVSNLSHHSRGQPAKRQQYLQLLLRSGSRLGRSQLARDLTATGTAVRDGLTAEDVDEIATAVADVQRWWP